MIPRILQIKNFLSYSGQVQTIDFTPYSLICLSGKNGHGKSALLDAITWAVWGQARKSQGTAKADEGIVRMGQTRAFVDFEFEMEGVIYRVHREFFKGYGKPIAGLEFQVADSATGTFKTLTCKTIRETQERIEQILKLDFETFLNTSFFRQGSSNEFSKKTPKERKQILSNILGLERYDLISDAALVQARSLQESLIKILATQELNIKEIEKIAEFEKSLKAIESHGLGLRKKIDESRAQVKQLDEKIASSELFLKNIQKLEESLAELKLDANAWRKIHANILSSPNLEKLEAQKNTLKIIEKKHLNEQADLLNFSTNFLSIAATLRERKQMLASLLEQQIEKLTFEAANKNFQFSSLEQLLQKNIADLSKFNTLHNDLIAQIEQSEKIIQGWQQEQKIFLCLQARQNQLLEYKEFSHQRMLACRDNMLSAKVSLESLLSCDKTCAVCPTCNRTVDADFAKRLQANFLWQQSFSRHKGSRLKFLHEQICTQILQNQQTLECFQLKATTAKAHEIKLVDLKKTLVELIKEIDTEQQAVKLNENKLKTMRDDCKQTEQLLKSLVTHKAGRISQQFADEKLQSMRMQLRELYPQKIIARDLSARQTKLSAKLEALETKLQQAVQAFSEVKAQAVRKITLIKNYAETRKQKTALYDKKHLIESQLLDLLAQKKYSQESLIETETLHQDALKSFGSIKQQLLQAKALEETLATQQAKIVQLKLEIDDFQVLAQAFGKNGIQALIIESVIPEIESEANLLLSQLSDEQAMIFIEPLKDLKKGGYKESLDIKISDSAGIRPYEMFSGGEAFRIDFALRIAISKLLAKRVGASLQTLIIDEGFGSQDQEGIARVMEAIYSVRKDFSKIIVVSHLQEMKDNFPVHFLVNKGLTGSTISVELRG